MENNNLKIQNDESFSCCLLKALEVATLLNISRSLAYNLMQTGEIPTVRFRGSVRVRREDLDEFINAHTVR